LRLHLARGSTATPATDFEFYFSKPGFGSAVGGTAQPPDPPYAGRPGASIDETHIGEFR
jgi:hypothetical protein